MKNQIQTAFRLLLVLTILTGVLYPLMVTAFSQLCFPYRANGSPVVRKGQIRGSELIGQQFTGSGYFWPRPSACSYSSLPSSGSNLGPTSTQLRDQMLKRRNEFISGNFLNKDITVPPEMLSASGSGLDPHISLQAALLQTDRIAMSRGYNSIKKQHLRELVEHRTENPKYSFFGNERVNVFMLNLELDNLK